jgi:hypothetical protein
MSPKTNHLRKLTIVLPAISEILRFAAQDLNRARHLHSEIDVPVASSWAEVGGLPLAQSLTWRPYMLSVLPRGGRRLDDENRRAGAGITDDHQANLLDGRPQSPKLERLGAIFKPKLCVFSARPAEKNKICSADPAKSSFLRAHPGLQGRTGTSVSAPGLS